MVFLYSCCSLEKQTHILRSNARKEAEIKVPVSNVDFGRTADDYLMHRAGFPESLFQRLKLSGLGAATPYVVDLGTGTGTLGRGFAKQGCRVTGVDPAATMLDAARTIDVPLGLATKYLVGTAEETTLPDHSFDLVTAGQCWHWFDAEKASSEIIRLLKPDGILLVAYYDWIPLTGNVVRRTEKLIEQHNPAWSGGNGTGIHPGLFRDLGEAGFTGIESFTYDEAAIYDHLAWRGRIRASAGIAATLDERAVQAFDTELADLLSEHFPTEPMKVPHRVFATLAKFEPEYDQ